jgi:hypothetical protein
MIGAPTLFDQLTANMPAFMQSLHGQVAATAQGLVSTPMQAQDPDGVLPMSSWADPNYTPPPALAAISKGGMPRWVVPAAIGVGVLGVGYLLFRSRRKAT